LLMGVFGGDTQKKLSSTDTDANNLVRIIRNDSQRTNLTPRNR